jgi:tRNA modification GTPase
MIRLDDTIAAIATPPGEGGVAIVRVSGPAAFSIADRVFRSKAGRPSAFPSHTIHYGRLTDSASGETVDDALLLAYKSPRSYTGEDVVEFSCHGGSLTARRVLQIALANGARAAQPGEFTQRAFLNGRVDLAQAEAVCDQIRSGTEAAHRIAVQQRYGALSRVITDLRDHLVHVLASVEVVIDFADDTGDFDHEALLPELRSISAEMARLIAEGTHGRLYREGARVAIVGQPNVGKSSLLNALLREGRAIVTSIPGTTRDTVEATANIRGLPVTLIDTAGLRAPSDAAERLGIERAQAAIVAASAVIVVADATAGWSRQDEAIRTDAGAKPVLRVLNKSDLLPPGAVPAIPDAILVSARTGAGVSALETALAAALIPGAPESSEGIVVSNLRHVRALEAALRSANAAESSCASHLPADLVAVDLRGALDALGEITGETVTEDVIEAIFRDFCMGK